MVERQIEDLRVGGSNPSLGTKKGTKMELLIIGYLACYISSVYFLQRDWRETFDLELTDLIIFLLCSIALIGIPIYLFKVVSTLVPNKTILKRY